MFSVFKRLFFWNYKRTAWQYDVLCLLILAFIFLTPKSWFESGELRNTESHHNTASSVLVLLDGSGSLSAELTAAEIERRARAALNRPDARVQEVRPRRDVNGQIVAYEVDIR